MNPGRLDTLLEAAVSSRRDACSDAELLSLFLRDRDERAFESLLRRHTPGVRASCRAWLRASADIDDAAQATFLVLVQRAGTIRDLRSLGPWLYGVAANVARRLRQRQRRAGDPLPPELADPQSRDGDDLADLLAAEIGRLPEKYRLPVQLCYSAGLTTAEAAERLGWPKGTVLTRLAWARERLQRILSRRGVAPAALAGLAATPASSAASPWVRQTTLAAAASLAGQSLASLGVPERIASLTEGVVRAMVIDRLKFLALAALLVIGLAGFGLGHWATAAGQNGDTATKGDGRAQAADDRPADPDVAAPQGKNARAGDDPRVAGQGRRREAVIRLPAGTFVKEVEVEPHGFGRVTWTYKEDQVVGLIEASVLGCEVELATEAEVSLSKNGTVYGLLTGVQLNRFRLPPVLGELQPFVGLVNAAEPLINESLMDVPFSYQCRLSGDRLTITNFRILLAGPTPLWKLASLLGDKEKELILPLAAFQALGTAIEGTYTPPDAKEKPARKRLPAFPKLRTPDRSNRG
jgi:RNA polymerase sigma factor (sigma-70 family)